MATLRFASGNRKVFTPVSSALANLPNGAGTMIALFKQSSANGNDIFGLLNSGGTSWYHALGVTTTGDGSNLWDDYGAATIVESPSSHTDTTNWFMVAVDWAATAGAERFHKRNQTGSGAGSPGSWAHENSGASNNAPQTGPGT